MSAETVVRTEGLTKSYDGTDAVRGLDLVVPRHSVFGFLGPNGAGKTTTMKMLLGLIRPSAGSGSVFGLDIVEHSPDIRARIGYLPQDPRFYEHMTARQTLRFAAGFFFSGPQAAIEDRVDAMLHLVGIADKADRPIKGFSGGERQRLGIAQAQIHEPELLILDEPAAALDPLGRRDVLGIIEGLGATSTVFYSTHILDDVQRVSDTVCILNNGEIVAQGPIAQVLDGGTGVTYSVEIQGDAQRAKQALLAEEWVDERGCLRGRRVRIASCRRLRPRCRAGEAAASAPDRRCTGRQRVQAPDRQPGGHLHRSGRRWGGSMTDSGVVGLQRVTESGWRSGLANLMRAGFHAWWGTRTWLIQAAIWTAVINGSLAAVVWGEAPEDLSAFSLYGVMTMFASIAVVVMMQEAIVAEKRDGTAAWVLSKPVSRPAFMLSKLVPNAIGVTATMIAIPSVFVLIQLVASGTEVSVGRFALGAGVATLNLMFYLTLTLMLGTLFDSAAPVIGIPLAFAFGQQLLVSIPVVGPLLPWSLIVPVGDTGWSVVGALIAGLPVPAPWTIVSTSIACVVFVAVAFWKWNRTEL